MVKTDFFLKKITISFTIEIRCGKQTRLLLTPVDIAIYLRFDGFDGKAPITLPSNINLTVNLPSKKHRRW